jgi:hypothetical protein
MVKACWFCGLNRVCLRLPRGVEVLFTLDATATNWHFPPRLIDTKIDNNACLPHFISRVSFFFVVPRKMKARELSPNLVLRTLEEPTGPLMHAKIHIGLILLNTAQIRPTCQHPEIQSPKARWSKPDMGASRDGPPNKMKGASSRVLDYFSVKLA